MFKSKATVVDHQPSVVESVFPTEVVTGLRDSHINLTWKDLSRLLGEKRFHLFNHMLIKSATIGSYGRDEFVDPVIPLYYYSDLQKVQSEQNREALKLHGSSHGVIEGIFNPESRILWRRIMEICEDIIIQDNLTKNAKSILNNYILINSLMPIEELRATYLRDWVKADENRKKKLQEFEEMDINNVYESYGEKQAKIDWPYITACKSFSLLKRTGFDVQKMEELIKKCDFMASRTELAQAEDWINEEDPYISSLPFLVSVLINSEKIKEGATTLEKVLQKPKRIECFELSTSMPKPQLRFENWFKKSRNVWKAWVLNRIIEAIVEGDLTLGALYYISDYVIKSFIIVKSEFGWKYEILVPKMVKHDQELAGIIAKIKFLLLQMTPTYNYDIEPKKGQQIKAFDIKFTFPKIKPKKESVGKIKELLSQENNFCSEIAKELKDYGEKINLERKVQTLLDTCLEIPIY